MIYVDKSKPEIIAEWEYETKRYRVVAYLPSKRAAKPVFKIEELHTDAVGDPSWRLCDDVDMLDDTSSYFTLLKAIYFGRVRLKSIP